MSPMNTLSATGKVLLTSPLSETGRMLPSRAMPKARAADPTHARDLKESEGSGLAKLEADATESRCRRLRAGNKESRRQYCITERTSVFSNLMLEHTEGEGSKQTGPLTNRMSSVCEKPKVSTAELAQAMLWSSSGGPSPWLPGASRLDPKRHIPKTKAAGPAWAKLRMGKMESTELKASANTAKLTRAKLRGDSESPALKPLRTSEDRSSRARPQVEAADATLARFRSNNRKPT